MFDIETPDYSDFRVEPSQFRSRANRIPKASMNAETDRLQNRRHLPRVVPPEHRSAMQPTLQFRPVRWLRRDFWVSQFRRIRVS